MGILEDLKKEAAEAKRKEAQARESTEARQTLMAQVIQPKVQSLYEYFGELKKHLEIVQPELHEEYDVRGFGKLAELRQCDYKLSTDDRAEEVSGFTFHYEYSRDGRREAKVTDRNVVASVREYLWAQNLRFSTRESGSATVISLENRVPVSFDFEADYEKSVIKLRIRNLDRLGMTIHSFGHDQIDSEFMDELAKRILGRPSRFDELCGDQLTQTTRLRLREQLEQMKRQREQELGAKRKKKRVVKKKESLSQKLGRALLGKK